MAKGLLLSPTTIRNFWRKLTRLGPDDCWVWSAGKNSDGYGAFTVRTKSYVATHIALILSGRPQPRPDAQALHGDCSNPACVNPDHLRWGTPKDNVADCIRLKRSRSYRGLFRGDQCPHSKLKEVEVREIRQSPLTGVRLADRYGVSTATISLIRNRKTWAHLD